MKVIKRIKSKSTDGFAARTDIAVVEINGEQTVHIYQIFISKTECDFAQLLVKRGDIYIYRVGIALRMNTLSEVLYCFKSVFY